MAVAPVVRRRRRRYRRRADGGGGGGAGEDLPPAWVGRRRGGLREQLLDSGLEFMALGALVLTWHRVTGCNPEHVLAALLLWLVGVALAALSSVAGRFPRLAAVGAAVATALRDYMVDGGL